MAYGVKKVRSYFRYFHAEDAGAEDAGRLYAFFASRMRVLFMVDLVPSKLEAALRCWM
jgi:hypothetical protein